MNPGARFDRLYEAVRRVVVDGPDSPGTMNELLLAFYSIREQKDYFGGAAGAPHPVPPEPDESLIDVVTERF